MTVAMGEVKAARNMARNRSSAQLDRWYITPFGIGDTSKRFGVPSPVSGTKPCESKSEDALNNYALVPACHGSGRVETAVFKMRMLRPHMCLGERYNE